MKRLAHAFLSVALLLAITHPVAAIVTVVPEATPRPRVITKPKSKPAPRPAAKPKVIPTATPIPSPLVGTWQGVEEGLVTLRTKGKSYQQRCTISITLVVPPGLQSVNGSYGVFSSQWIGSVPPGNQKQGSAPARAFGPYAARLNGNTLEWTDNAGGNDHFAVTLTPAANGALVISEKSTRQLSGDGQATSAYQATLTRVR